MVSSSALPNNWDWLIVGRGRLGSHMAHYASLLGVTTQIWARAEHSEAQLLDWAASSERVLLCVADGALASLYQQIAPVNPNILHFSGATHIEGLACAHPLMTFAPNLYRLELYQQLHFCITGAEHLQELLPELNNPFSVIAPEDKAKYHAACVIGGNFTTLVTAKMLALLGELGVPESAAGPYMQQILSNVLANPANALTGPIARQDAGTVQRNLNALEGDAYQQVYRAFLSAHWPSYPEKSK